MNKINRCVKIYHFHSFYKYSKLLGKRSIEARNMGFYMNITDTSDTEMATGNLRPAITHVCQVIELTPLNSNTFQVELKSTTAAALNYQAGQYLQLELDVNNDGHRQFLSYSIANRFDHEHPRRLQLFIQNSSEFADKILKTLAELASKKRPVKVRMPMGQAFLQTDLSLPHVMIAAGSGISKIKCLTEELLRRQPDADVKVYWSNRKVGDFYLLDQFQDWVNQNNNLNFTPILESAEANWSGRSGYIYKVIEEDFEDLDGTQVYLCGSPRMVYGTIVQLKASGLKEKDCYSDVFEYAPQEQNIVL